MKKIEETNFILIIALFFIILSNIYGSTNVYLNIPFMNTILTYGGILGTSLIFIVSGYKIYYEIYSLKKANYSEYLKKIFSKKLLIYYLSLAILLILTNKASFISLNKLDILLSHLFLYNNLYVDYAGAINGTFWFLGSIVQFILIAPIIYKLLEKFPKFTVFLSTIITFFIKVFIYKFIFGTVPDINSNYYFIYAFQVFTAGFLFVIGMFIAKIFTENKKYNNFLLTLIALISCVSIYCICKITNFDHILFINSTQPFENSVFSYCWLHILGIFLGLLVYVMIYYSRKIRMTNINNISEYIFCIYLWHLVIINNLYTNSPLVNSTSKYPIILYAILVAICILFGVMYEKIISSFDGELFLKNNKKILKTIVVVLTIVLSCYCLLKTFEIIKPMINNYKIFASNGVTDNNPSRLIANEAEKIMTDKSSCKYIYIDGEETGYLYFYQLRYYLSPCETIHFNMYSPIINYKDINEIYDYLKNVDVNYYIIKENDKISKALNVSFDSVNGSIYKKNNNSTSIKDLFILTEKEQ